MTIKWRGKTVAAHCKCLLFKLLCSCVTTWKQKSPFSFVAEEGFNLSPFLVKIYRWVWLKWSSCPSCVWLDRLIREVRFCIGFCKAEIRVYLLNGWNKNNCRKSLWNKISFVILHPRKVGNVRYLLYYKGVKPNSCESNMRPTSQSRWDLGYAQNRF